MYRFALRPRWILSHLLVIGLVVVMVNLGFWQLRRLDERQAQNQRTEARMALDPVPVTDLVSPGTGDAALDAAVDRSVVATGTYVAGEQVLVRGRSLDGAPGSWVLAPLRLDDGDLVVVNRGWIANDGSLRAVPERFAPPAGTVTVTGRIQETQTRGDFGSQDPATGELDTLARVDVARYAQQLDAPVLGAWVQLTGQRPPVAADAPVVLGPPDLSNGPHLSYAVQWFIFSTIALVGYPIILRHVARDPQRRRGRGSADPPGDDDDPDDPDARGGPGSGGDLATHASGAVASGAPVGASGDGSGAYGA